MAKENKQSPAVEYPPDLAGLLEKLPAGDAEAGQKICRELIARGPKLVARLLDLVGEEFGLPGGVGPKYALHGMVVYASRPKAEKERKMVAAALAAELGSRRSAETKAFICRQLQLCGTDAEVPALAALLGDERLCEPATQALLAIGSPAAGQAVAKALAGAAGKRKVTLLKAAGRLRVKAASAAARKALDDADRNARLVAYYALANLPDPQAGTLLAAAAGRTKGFEHDRAVAETLRAARRLGEASGAAGARKAIEAVAAPARKARAIHVQAAALHDLAATGGVAAVGEVLKAMGSDDLWIRNAAARTAVRLAGRIRTTHPAEAKSLLKKAAAATQEAAVVQQAELMLAGTI